MMAITRLISRLHIGNTRRLRQYHKPAAGHTIKLNASCVHKTILTAVGILSTYVQSSRATRGKQKLEVSQKCAN